MLKNLLKCDTDLKCLGLSTTCILTLFALSFIFKSFTLFALSPFIAIFVNNRIGKAWMKHNPDFNIDEHEKLDTKARTMKWFFALFIFMYIFSFSDFLSYMVFDNVFPLISTTLCFSLFLIKKLYIVITDAPFGIVTFYYRFNFDYNLTPEEIKERDEMSKLAMQRMRKMDNGLNNTKCFNASRAYAPLSSNNSPYTSPRYSYLPYNSHNSRRP